MAQTATTIKMDSELKNKFDKLCAEFGMSINTAINIFAKAVVRSRSIPFKIEADDVDMATIGRNAFHSLRRQAISSGQDLSLDDINHEINEVRKNHK